MRLDVSEGILSIIRSSQERQSGTGNYANLARIEYKTLLLYNTTCWGSWFAANVLDRKCQHCQEWKTELPEILTNCNSSKEALYITTILQNCQQIIQRVLKVRSQVLSHGLSQGPSPQGNPENVYAIKTIKSSLVRVRLPNPNLKEGVPCRLWLSRLHHTLSSSEIN